MSALIPISRRASCSFSVVVGRSDGLGIPGLHHLRHLAERDGWGFGTLERGRELPLGLALVPRESAVLFDSVTACLACQMFSGPQPDAAAPERTAEELLTVSRHPRHFVCVCDELWRDGVTYEPWTEHYRRGLAEICRALAAEFDAVAELSAGCVRVWKGELPDA